jgi:dTDP-4-dehydrorhamnose reductase
MPAMTHTLPRILLLGMNGQVGWELQRSLAPLGELIALDRWGHPQHMGTVGDLRDLEGLARTVQLLRPDVIVNAAAHTAVDKAESETDLCRVLNTEAPAVLARCAAASGAWLVHYSTDYVFDGTGNTPWTEQDTPAPVNVYGHTKLEGERAIVTSGCRHLIFRTSWVYGARGGNFAKTMLRLAQERDQLTVIDDQFGAPTGADLLADVTAHAIRRAFQAPSVQGLYHLVAAGETSWHGYARYVLSQAQAFGAALKVDPDAVTAVPTSAFPTPARRPRNSRLNTELLQHTFGLRLPHWHSGVTRMLTEHLRRG